jgi:hypothetical protein
MTNIMDIECQCEGLFEDERPCVPCCLKKKYEEALKKAASVDCMRKEVKRVRLRLSKCEDECERLRPYCSGRDENKVTKALGQVHRLSTGKYGASIGVVNVNIAREALLSSYAENNVLSDRAKEIQENIKGIINKIRNRPSNIITNESVITQLEALLKI